MQDWMFETGVDPLTWPEPQPNAPEGASWFESKPAGEDDWLTPLQSWTLPDVIVEGPRPNPTTPGGGNGEWDGHDTSQTQPPPTLEQLPVCVSAAPQNVDEDSLMSVLRHLTDYFRVIIVLGGSRFEYGVLICELNGQIGFGDIHTDNSYDFVNITTRGLPDGARIIAYMHNHLDQDLVDDGVPSYHPGGDWDAYDALVSMAALPRGITVDPNLLLVLFSNQDNKTRIYDKTDKNTTTPSCAI